MAVMTRFAPSPSGDLHLGHAYAARFARDLAMTGKGGRFLVRIEDIDANCREVFLTRNLEDLRWLGLTWAEPLIRQSARQARYTAALDELARLGVTYPCFCTRKQIRAEIDAAGAAPHAVTADGSLIYPGRCRDRPEPQRRALIAGGRPFAIRLDSARALQVTGRLSWTDAVLGTAAVSLTGLGDVVVARKAAAASYHLACVVDDAEQGITHVTRGEDLIPITPLHRTLQALLGLPEPRWHHHPLCVDQTGRRLAKRHDALSIRTLRASGLSPAAVFALAEQALAPPFRAMAADTGHGAISRTC